MLCCWYQIKNFILFYIKESVIFGTFSVIHPRFFFRTLLPKIEWKLKISVLRKCFLSLCSTCWVGCFLPTNLIWFFFFWLSSQFSRGWESVSFVFVIFFHNYVKLHVFISMGFSWRFQKLFPSIYKWVVIISDLS